MLLIISVSCWPVFPADNRHTCSL